MYANPYELYQLSETAKEMTAIADKFPCRTTMNQLQFANFKSGVSARAGHAMLPWMGRSVRPKHDELMRLLTKLLEYINNFAKNDNAFFKPRSRGQHQRCISASARPIRWELQALQRAPQPVRPENVVQFPQKFIPIIFAEPEQNQ